MGIESAKLQPALFRGLRGLAATADIAADELVISVPRSAAITLAPKQRCPIPDLVRPDFWDASPWYVKLALLLLAEQRLGSSSRLAPYISQLPQHIDSPVNWSPERLQRLQYPHLIHQVTEQQQQWGQLHEALQSNLAPGAAPIPRQVFFWALSAVRSRTFAGPYVASTLQDRLRLAGVVGVLIAANTLLFHTGLATSFGAAAAAFAFNILYEVILAQKLRQYAMCPVIDLANHSSSGTAEASYDYLLDAFVVTSQRRYSPGQQVYVSYGRYSNDGLMQWYGFAEANNPDDVYVMTSMLKWLEQLQPLGEPQHQAALDQLNSNGLLAALQEVRITRQGFAPDTLKALRMLLAVVAPGGGGGGAAGAAAPGVADTAGGGEADLEARLALVLAHAVQCEMAAAGGSVQEEERALARAQELAGSQGGGAGGVAPAPAADVSAISFRLEKKRILTACLSALRGEAVPGAAGSAGR